MTRTASTRSRLDQLLVDRGLAETRSRAQALVLAGRVRVGSGDGARSDRKPGEAVPVEVPLEVATPQAYVSRGGDKLAGALDEFGVDPARRICLDVGASTGGFTDCLLQRGASRVHAIDVGRGQLAARIVGDPRVVVHDRTNARSASVDLLAGDAPDLAVIDVSFISLSLVLGPIMRCLARGGEVIALVKPQFEAGRTQVHRGVVREPAVHRAVLLAALGHARAAGLSPRALCASPLVGPAGNREFFLHAVKAEAGAPTASILEAGSWEARIAVLAPG